MAAREALAERKQTFFPTLAREAMARKYPGARGARSSRAQERSREMVATIFQRLGLASKRSLTRLAKIMPPTCPIPSLMIQLRAAARGMAPAPRPMA